MTREEAIQTLNVMLCQYSHIRKNDSEWEAIHTAIEALQERPKGRWEEYPNNAHLRCTNCKIEFAKEKMPKNRNFCSNCGADMKGE